MTSDLAGRFAALSGFLREAELLWRPSPFMQPRLAWVAHQPELGAACLALSDQALAHLEASPIALQQWLLPFLPNLQPLAAHTHLPQRTQRSVQLPKRWDTGIGGRKAAQLRAFIAALTPAGTGFVDWCSGKAHLGRGLAWLHAQPCLALERDFALCQAGSHAAAQAQLPVHFVTTDALAPGLKLPCDYHVVALHACGDLHRSLLRRALAEPLVALSLAPCCYALWLTGNYQPLSNAGRSLNLHLGGDALHLAVQESVTASARNLAQSQTLSAWRLGFDGLQRELRRSDSYLPTPSLPLSALQLGFVGCCQQLARAKNLALEAAIDWPRWESHGHRRLAQVRRLQLARHAFRRALEVWLVLDGALSLEEGGYRVTLSEFCERPLTPRNILLEAYRR